MINTTFENTPVRNISGKAQLIGTAQSHTKSGSGISSITFADVPQAGADLKVTAYTNNLLNSWDKKQTTLQAIFCLQEPIYLLPNQTYTATAYSATTPRKIYFLQSDGSYTNPYAVSDASYSCSFTPTEEVAVVIAFSWGSGGVPADAQFKLEEGAASTEFTTYNDLVSGSTVTVSGKNLIDYTQATGRNATQKVEITDNGVVWKAGGSYFFIIPAFLPANATVTCSWVSGNAAGEELYNWQFLYSDGTYTTGTQYISGISRTTEKEVAGIYLYKQAPAAALEQDLLITNIQLEYGAAATPYEPYQEPQSYTISANGKTTGLKTIAPTMIISTDSALNINASYTYETKVDGAVFASADRLKSFELERLGESKFFGYGVAQKANIKLIDTNRELNFTTDNKFKLSLNEVEFTPELKVTEVHRNENNNELSITVYDALEQAAAHTVEELSITSYTIGDFAQACAALLGLEAALEPLEAFNLYFDGGANFEGTETIREALNDVAEATQTIYFINSENKLVFKRLDAEGAPVATIDKENYMELDSKSNRRLVGVCSATELGDNVEAKLDLSGTTQYVRNNAFWELRQDVAQLVEDALAAVGGLTLAQFNCRWRGDYRLEIGDKMALQAKDNSTIISYLLNDALSYDGSLTQKTQWEYEDTEESASNPTTLGEALKYTYARVDKQEKQIDIVASEVSAAKSELAAIQLNTDKISASVSSIEQTATDAVESINKELNTLTQKVEAQITAEDVKIEVQKELAAGANKVTTTTGFTFNEDGLKVSKSESDFNTTITEDGMHIKKGSKEVLTANNEGVKAIDLHATTFLIIGKNSRFEDYKSNRTACFWIGG